MPRIAPLARLLRAPVPLSQAQVPRLATTSTKINLIPALRSLRLTSVASTSRLPSTVSIFGSTTSLRPTLLPSSVQTQVQLQTRGLAYGAMYQPSQRKRKRKHGFLSRARGGRLGQKTLARRAARGRRFLSH